MGADDASLRDGMNWAPSGTLPRPVVAPGDFVFASAFFDHGHIFGQTQGLTEAGGICKWAWDPDPVKLGGFCERFPGVKAARDWREVLDDPEVALVTAAAIPNQRSAIGMQVMEAGKDYYTDKSPFTTLGQLAEVRRYVAETGRKYFCDYSERLHTEAGWYAGELIRQGAIGRVLQVLILAPHNLSKSQRPPWFFEKEKYGGILTDIGSHQFEQFLTYSGAEGARILSARVENFANPDKPGFEDFGEASLLMDSGASCYCRLDWFNPPGHRSWGDGRTFILGTHGTIEVRKYNDLARHPMESQVIYLVDGESEKRIPCEGRIGYPFYGKFILDCLNRTELAMTQEHCFRAAELSMMAQAAADSSRQNLAE